MDIYTYFKGAIYCLSARVVLWWNEICSSKIEPTNVWRILFAVELGQRQRKSNLSSTDKLVLDVEFLKILNYFNAVYQKI